MIDSNTICFIPVRGGSKGIKNKNIKKLENKTLTDITIELALKSKLFKKIIVSSDSLKILNIAKKYKKIFFLRRSKKNSKDSSTTEEALIESLKKIDLDFENIIILQATSPLRKIHTVKKFLNYCISRDLKTCCTVTKIDDPIALDGNYYSPIFQKKIRRRQLRKKFMYENGLIYFVKKKFFLQRKKIYPDNNWSYFETNRYESIDINNYDDLIISRLIYKKF